MFVVMLIFSCICVMVYTSYNWTLNSLSQTSTSRYTHIEAKESFSNKLRHSTDIDDQRKPEFENTRDQPIILSGRNFKTSNYPDKSKEKHSRDLGDWMQQKLASLQNPANCSSAKKLVCQLRNCGATCQIHHVSYCLILALATLPMFVKAIQQVGSVVTWAVAFL